MRNSVYWVADPGLKDQRIEGCYGSFSGSSKNYGGVYTSVGTSSSWCFSKEGFFSHDKVLFGSSNFASMQRDNPQRNGKYYIDGYGIAFKYNSGETVYGGFAFLDEQKEHIAINNHRFMD